MKIIEETKSILGCTAFDLIVPCSRFGTLNPQNIRDNYNVAAQYIETAANKTKDPEGTVIECNDPGLVQKNFLNIIGIVVLEFAHVKCKNMQALEKCLYEIKNSFSYVKKSIGIYSIEQWVEEEYIPIALELICKYLENSVETIIFYK